MNQNLTQHWTCETCTLDMLPLNACPNDRVSDTLGHPEILNTTKPCNVCNKLGNRYKLTTCWICEMSVHSSCSLGKLGCRSCHQNIFPGDIISKTTSSFVKLETAFNPYTKKHAATYVAEFDSDAHKSTDMGTWQLPSSVLDSCNYTPSHRIKGNLSKQIQILSSNIRSLSRNIDNIRENLEFYQKFDIICFNETNLNEENLPFGGNELHLDDFHSPFLQRPARSSSRGGGLAIYVHTRLGNPQCVKIRPNLCENSDPLSGEFLTIEIQQEKAKNIVVCNYYRSPNSDYLKFSRKIEELLTKLGRDKHKRIFLMGDSNINLLDYGKSDHCTKFIDKLTEYGFAQLISRPTRVTNHSATLIDHIFSNDCSAITKSGIVSDFDLSDHLATFVRFTNFSVYHRDIGTSAPSRIINKASMETFRREIESTDWSYILNLENADNILHAISGKYQEIYNKHFPLLQRKPRNIRSRRKPCPWLLDWLKCACARKNSLYRKFIKNPIVENEIKYLKMKKFVRKHTIIAKKKFYTSYFEEHVSNSKKQWAMINNLLNRKPKGRTNISKLEYKGQKYSNNRDIAEAFNHYFKNIAQELKNKIKPNAADHTGTIKQIPSNSRCRKSMPSAVVPAGEVATLIRGLKDKATSDISIKPLKLVG